jgi:hypothetical protein
MSSVDLEFYLYFNTPMIDFEIWSNTDNEYTRLSVIFDTGAYLTTISSVIADILGYMPIGSKTSISSVGGSKEAFHSIYTCFEVW